MLKKRGVRMKKKLGLPILYGAVLSFFATVVFAANEDAFLGGLITSILKTIQVILQYQFRIPLIGGGPPEYHHLVLVAGVFFVFFTILFAICRRLPIFNHEGTFHRGPAIGFSLGIAALAIFTKGVLDTAKSMMESFSILFWLGIMILIVIGVWFTITSGARGLSQMNSGAATELAKTRTEEFQARRLEQKERADLNQAERLVREEQGELQGIENDIKQLNVDGMQEEAALRAILQTLRRIEGVRSEGQGMQLKATYRRQMGTVIAEVAHENKDLQDYFNKIQKLRADSIAEFRDEREVEAICTRIQGLTQMPPRERSRLTNLTKMVHKEEAESMAQVADLIEKTQEIRKEDEQAVRAIQQGAADFTSGNISGAIQAISAALQTKERVIRHIADSRHYEQNINALDARKQQLYNQLQHAGVI